MTAADTALQLVRSCLKQAYGLTDSQVIKADVRGPRPALPYLTVRIGSANVPIGEGLEIVQFPLSRATVALDDPGTVYTLTITDDDSPGVADGGMGPETTGACGCSQGGLPAALVPLVLVGLGRLRRRR